MGVSVEEIQARVASLAENNPMLGHRGCRLGITFPEITAMQTRAILSAACELKKEGKNPMPEIMVPLIGILYELKQQKEIIQRVASSPMMLRRVVWVSFSIALGRLLIS